MTLFGENAPYILTIFVALTGWTLTELTDELSSAPTLGLKMKECEEKNNICMEFKNISPDVAFQNIEVSIFDVDVICNPVPTIKAVSGIELSQNYGPDCEKGRSILLKLSSLQPSASFWLEYSKNGNEETYDDIAVNADGPITVLHNIFWMMIIDYKKIILVLLLFLWSFMIPVFIIMEAKSNGRNRG